MKLPATASAVGGPSIQLIRLGYFSLVWASASFIMKNYFLCFGRSMRITGTFLLLGGALLCVSIVWAAIGFLMMGFGLICLLIAERRRQSTAPAASRSDRVDARREPPPLLIEKNAPSAQLVQISPSRIDRPSPSASLPLPSQPKPSRPALASRKERPDRRRNEPKPVPYDIEKWRALVTGDADISRSVEALQPFGQKYVDQLAIAYLAFGERSYLPKIIKLVASAIKKDSGRDSADADGMDDDPNADLISFAMSKARPSVVEQIFASPALNVAPTEESSAVSKQPPESDPVAGAKLAAVQSELKTSRGRPEGEAGSTKPQSAIKGVNERPLAVAPAREARASGDDARDLTDLFNKIA